jgi:hypothetical protein
MRCSTLGPFPAPHKTKEFWTFVAPVMIASLCAPFILPLLGLPLHRVTIRGWLASVFTGWFILVPVCWLGFRYGRIAWAAIGVGWIVLAFVLRYSV